MSLNCIINSNCIWQRERTKAKVLQWVHLWGAHYHWLSLSHVLVAVSHCYAPMQFHVRVNSPSSFALFAIISRFHEHYFHAVTPAFVLFVSVSINPWRLKRRPIRKQRFLAKNILFHHNKFFIMSIDNEANGQNKIAGILCFLLRIYHSGNKCLSPEFVLTTKKFLPLHIYRQFIMQTLLM